ncbi:Snaclec crotocetin [Orchesella cincta]|uniref:Snaclec crotocetin n=1 Tax=Orchesella cincta TaxID=48709 RepID=A0A1D2M988_ORCCI|nr:Snaclec crotocetin [Orchesella cincta]
MRNTTNVVLIIGVGCMILGVVNGKRHNVTGMANLGSVDGKTYFADKSSKSWQESRTYCENRGMQMASIKSQKQVDHLKAAYHPRMFDGWYWVNAKGLKKSPSFKWEKTGEGVTVYNNVHWVSWNNTEMDENCLIYSSSNHRAAYYFPRGCQHGHQALCEISQTIQPANNPLPDILETSEADLIELGEFGGKAFYTDHILRNWVEASLFCQQKGLQLAIIATKPLRKVIKEATSKIRLDTYYWVATGDSYFRNEGEDLRCPSFQPFRERSFTEQCYRKHFTICESIVNPFFWPRQRQP